MRNNFSEFLLSASGFELRGQSLRVPIRLPWYRALPLSVAEIGSLIVDGASIPPTNIQLIVNGNAHPATAFGSLTDEWWYVLDDAILEAQLPRMPAPGPHTVELSLQLYPPYIPGLVWTTQAQREYPSA